MPFNKETHLYFNDASLEKTKWQLHINAACCFEQIVDETLYKTAAVRLLTSHLSSHHSRTSKSRQTHNRRFFMESYTWTYKCWSTSKNLHSSALCGHWMQFSGLLKGDSHFRRIARGSKRNPCCLHALVKILVGLVSLF